ncbi:MAG: CehA/McbA family metallohydrolase [Chloroflexia bacterium]
MLLLGGEEMTNWPHGHAVAVGLSPGDWLDWRQRPAGIPLGPGEERIVRFIAEARALGAFISAAHPASGRLAWQFIVEGEADPQARPHGLEVWNGPWQFDDEIALALWDHLLRQGWRVSASGGSDTHGLQNTEGVRPGLPTTVVYADELSKVAIVAALKAGRCFVAHSPRGPDLYLTAEGPNEQSEIVGGTVCGGADERVEFSARIKGAEGANCAGCATAASSRPFPPVGRRDPHFQPGDRRRRLRPSGGAGRAGGADRACRGPLAEDAGAHQPDLPRSHIGPASPGKTRISAPTCCLYAALA